MTHSALYNKYYTCGEQLGRVDINNLKSEEIGQKEFAPITKSLKWQFFIADISLFVFYGCQVSNLKKF